MRVLIGYQDDDECSRAAVDDLSRAGLGNAEVEARVMSVAPLTSLASDADIEQRYPALAWLTRERQQFADAQAAAAADHGAQRLRALMPGWNVEAVNVAGTAHRELIDTAERWPADLLVIGSHRRGVLGRLFHGSVAQMCVNYSRRSVRIARPRPAAAGSAPAPMRLVVAVDDSPMGDVTLRQVASRHWPAGSRAWVIHVVDSQWVPQAMGADPEQVLSAAQLGTARQELLERGRELVQEAAQVLATTGLQVTPVVTEGRPRYAINELVERESADCVFLGAVGHRLMERLVLGSVASAVAAGAPCSVEVVRP